MLKAKAALSSCLLLISLFAGSDELELRQLNVLFRHGDRMPETFPKRFPNDPHMNDSFDPVGPGSLTNEGKRRMYRLGEFLRNRYADFLGSEYEESRLHGMSSSLSRTKMSLQLVQAALYPPTMSSRTRWHGRLDWQPIPAYYLDFKRDMYFNRDKCQKYVEELARVIKLPEIQAKIKEFESYLEHLRLTVGKKSPLTLNDILLLHNNLDIEKRMNMTMEPWMTDVLADERLNKMRLLSYEIMGYNNVLRRLHSGVLLRHISENMLGAQNKKSNYYKKTFLFSGHDKNIIALLQSLKIYDSHFPEFGSALIFELLSENNEDYVKILYYLGIPEELKNVTIPGCDSLCPLKKFIELTKSENVLDDDLDCPINQDTYFVNED